MGSLNFAQISGQRGRPLGKIDASLNEKLKNVEWGEYTYDRLFSTVAVKRKLSRSDVSTDGRTPIFSSESENNGIMGYTDQKPDYHVDEKTPIYLIFCDHTRNFCIASMDFCVADNVKILEPKVPLSKRQLLYITSAWKKCIENKGYARHWGTAKSVRFLLPAKNGEIDFDFMESFIAELEAEQLYKLDDYLAVTGLKDTTLTEDEEKALNTYESMVFNDYKLTDVFDVANAGNILSRDIREGSGTTPYLCASAENNAVSSYISYDEKQKNEGNCIFIGGKTFVVTYQQYDFYSNDSHNITLRLKDTNYKTRNTQLYLVSCVYKSLNALYSWGDSISYKKAQNNIISLPTKDGNIDYAGMSILISAIQKLVIKNVVAYSNEKSEQ